VVNRATTVRSSAEPTRSTLIISRDFIDNSNRITVSGAISAAAGAYSTSVTLQNPRGYALTLFSEKLSEQFPESDIRVAGAMRKPADAQNIGYATRSMAEVLRPVNKNSDNLNAEMLLYVLGHQQNSEPSTAEKGIAVVQRFMERLGHQPDSYRMVDGSGLSNQNYLSPEQLVDVLKHMHQTPHFEMFRQSMAIAGVDGTLASRMRNTAAHRRVHAKTGSLTGVSTLAGYATASNGNTLAFAIMVQNFTERAAFVATNYIDRICAALAK